MTGNKHVEQRDCRYEGVHRDVETAGKEWVGQVVTC